MEKIIDLHGMTEDEAILNVDSSLWELDEGVCEELHIITGNGAVLKGVVIDILNQQSYSYHMPSNNQGMIIVKR